MRLSSFFVFFLHHYIFSNNIVSYRSGAWSPGSPSGSMYGMSPSGAYSPTSDYGSGFEGLQSPGYSPTSPSSAFGGVMSPRYSPTSPS